nr:probable chitinase 10 [Rhipicephalus microplus]
MPQPDGHTGVRRYWRLQDTYVLTLLPVYYCSAMVIHGYAIWATGTLVWKYPTAVQYLIAWRDMRSTGKLSHRGKYVPIYFTIGGAREDSTNLSFVLVHTDWAYLAAKVKDEIGKWNELFTGVNIDWDYPGDPCNPSPGTFRLFPQLIRKLRLTAKVPIMISVPPVKSRLDHFSLDQVAANVDYIIIKTHTHTAPRSLFNVVRCSGDQSVAADVFNEALNMIPALDQKSRLGYSISVAPETFLAPVAQLGAPILGTMQWDNHTRQPGRTSYASVCQEKPVIRTSSHPLCLMVARQVDSQTREHERALLERMRLTYSNKMAMAPVAVFDIDLDDFNGTCGSGMSPLIRAVATGRG